MIALGPSRPSYTAATEALECFDKALEIDPRHADAWYHKGVLLAIQSEEIKVYEKQKLFFSLPNLQEFSYKAIECFDKALAYDPNNVRAWCYKGIILRDLYEPKPSSIRHIIELPREKIRRALECFDKALEIDPLCVDAWGLKGVFLRESHQYEKALECFDKALEIDQNNEKILNDRARVIKAINILKQSETNNQSG